MAKKGYYLDSSGSRCRERATGVYADCSKCTRCLSKIKKG